MPGRAHNSAMDDREAARPLCAAGALFVDDEGGVMIVDPTYAARWALPGGQVQRGETPREACERALERAFAIEVPLGRLLVVDWAPEVAEDRVRFVFDGGVLTEEQLDAIQLAPDEIAAWAFLPAEELFVMTTPRVARRVTAALDARADGATRYLENGMAVDSELRLPG